MGTAAMALWTILSTSSAVRGEGPAAAAAATACDTTCPISSLVIPGATEAATADSTNAWISCRVAVSGTAAVTAVSTKVRSSSSDSADSPVGASPATACSTAAGSSALAPRSSPRCPQAWPLAEESGCHRLRMPELSTAGEAHARFPTGPLRQIQLSWLHHRPGRGALELEADHRRHAEIENAIRDFKYGVGLNHLPSGRFAANGAWLAVRWPTTWPAGRRGSAWESG